jgi:hypothetical protein
MKDLRRHTAAINFYSFRPTPLQVELECKLQLVLLSGKDTLKRGTPTTSVAKYGNQMAQFVLNVLWRRDGLCHGLPQ